MRMPSTQVRGLRRFARSALEKLGYRLIRLEEDSQIQHRDICEAAHGIYNRCWPYTMTNLERTYALYQAVGYVVRHNVPGAVVECGVWRGGSAMAAALSLLEFGDSARPLFLYDTFAGMTEPGQPDVDLFGRVAHAEWAGKRRDGFNEWCHAPLDEVRRNMAATGYPADRIVYVKGRVEDTIPRVLPDNISVLRLDTDWYESTRHELEHLYPLLSPGGVLIVDDYGYWNGARTATDDYFAETGHPILLHRVDGSARVGVKLTEKY
jgi:O-methyltransferase